MPTITPTKAAASKMGKPNKPPALGFGLGLRPQHYHDLLDAENAADLNVDWFEIISENYMVRGGKPLIMLDRVAERYPLVMHGVSMSIASTAPLDEDYLEELKTLERRIKPKWISDHLCWTGVHGINLHDLLPFPYTEEALDHITARVHHVQERLGRPLCLENVSTYVEFKMSEMLEWEFIAELTKRTGCFLLVDINNIYVSATNHGYDAELFLESIPADRVVQLHLAGHSDMGNYLIDTHDQAVAPQVWNLYEAALRRFAPVSVMIERDDRIPPLPDLVAELEIARKIAAGLEIASSRSATGQHQ